ncbi:MAG: radical SAM protein [Nitrososphaerales archaeon]
MKAEIKIDREILRYRCVRESQLYTKKGDRIRCDVCERRCQIPLNGLGFCRTRANIDGKLYTIVYGDISSISSNPIEKKPFFHYWPGSYALTIGTWSCNFTCPWCLPQGSLVLTQEGITTVEDVFSQVRKGFEVKLYTHEGRFRRVVNTFAHDFQGSLIRFKPAYLNQEISITPSHRVLVCRRNQLKWVPASQLLEGDIVLVPVPKEGPDFHPVLDLKETILPELKPLRKRRRIITKEIIGKAIDLKKKGFSWRYICRLLKVSDHLRRVIESRNPTSPSTLIFEKNGLIRMKFGRYWIPRFVELDRQLARLIGYYLAEGYVTKEKDRTNSYSLSFVFNEKEEEFVKDVTAIIKSKFGIEARVWADPKYHICYVSIYNSLLSLLFKKLFGSGKRDKKMPLEYLFIPLDLQEEIIKGLFRGNGLSVEFVTRSYPKFKTHERIQITSPFLRAQVYLILCRLGFIPSQIGKEIYVSDSDQTERILSLMQGSDMKLEERKKGKIFGYIDGKYLYLKIREMKRLPYDGLVYDFEVKDDHSFTTPFIVVGNCQNYDISKYYPKPYKAHYISPEDFVNLAISERCQGVSFSFNEPTLLFEYAIDVFPLVRRSNMYANYVSNGYMTLEALKALKEAGMDAIKFDVKGNADAVKRFCAANVEIVWRNVSEAKKMGLHVEVVNLIIPRVNDEEFCIKEIAQRHIKEAGESTPLHFTRFYPAYKMIDRPQTPISTLEKAHEIAKKEGLQYVYIGNVIGHRLENTYCHNCNELLIKRYGFSIVKYSITSDKRCPKCREKIPIVGNYVNFLIK